MMVVAARNPLAQMGFEDDYAYSTGSYGSSTSHLDITRYALGAKGIDRIEKVVDSTSSSPTTVIQYPLYDAHGNMVATLSKGSSSGTYTVGNQRAFEPWGSVFDSSGLSNTPKQAYCASLGHVADSELGLTYMRARYYEPVTGRFISEDPAMNGHNWFSYCEGDPVSFADSSGRMRVLPGWRTTFDTLMALGGLFLVGATFAYERGAKSQAMALFVCAAAFLASGIGGLTDVSATMQLIIAAPGLLAAMAMALAEYGLINKQFVGAIAGFFCLVEMGILCGLLATIDGESGGGQ